MIKADDGSESEMEGEISIYLLHVKQLPNIKADAAICNFN